MCIFRIFMEGHQRSAHARHPRVGCQSRILLPTAHESPHCTSCKTFGATMWKKSSYMVVFATFAALAVAQNAATSSTRGAGPDVLITLPIQIDGSTRDLQLMRGETVEDAAVTFARNHGLLANSDAARVRAVVDQLSGLLRGRMEELQASETATLKPTVQLTMPLTINGATRDFKKLESETVEVAVERFLYDGGYSMDVMRELYPQIVEIVVQKLDDLKPARKELFSFHLSIDGREATARHFENGDPMEEARETFRVAGITDAAFIERSAPQIAQEIVRRIAERASVQPISQDSPPPSSPPAPANELFSIPLTVNNRPTILVHYEGFTSRESAARYLDDNGLASADGASQMSAQIVQIIENKIAEMARDEEEQKVAALAAQATTSRRLPLVRLPITIGDNQEANLEYFEGDSVERTVELFLKNIGMQEGPMFDQNAAQLADALQRQVSAAVAARGVEQGTSIEPLKEEQPVQTQPYVQLPVTLSGRVFDLMYYEGEQPGFVANTFCVEKHEIIWSELGLQFDGDQLLECKNLLEKTLKNLIAEKQQQSSEGQPRLSQQVANSQQLSQQVPQRPARGEFLLSFDIEFSGQSVTLSVYENDDPEQLARAFCDEHNLDYSNVGPIMEVIQKQAAMLK